MPSRFKTSFGKRFDTYLRTRFSEHHRRIVKGRSNARWALFTWPLTGLVLAMLPAGAVTIAIAVLYQQNHPRVAEVLTPESAPIVMPILYALCAGSARWRVEGITHDLRERETRDPGPAGLFPRALGSPQETKCS